MGAATRKSARGDLRHLFLYLLRHLLPSPPTLPLFHISGKDGAAGGGFALSASAGATDHVFTFLCSSQTPPTAGLAAYYA